MNNLWIYGCSFSESSTHNQELCEKHDKNKTDSTNIYKYFEYRNGSLPDSWDVLLSKKLGVTLKNCGKSGTGNQQIFHKFTQTYDNIKEGDIVIIEWTFIERFRLAFNDNMWGHLLPNTFVATQDYNISKITMEEISYNRLYKIYEEEIYDYMRVINSISQLKKFNLYFWTIDKRLIYTKLDREKNILLGDLVTLNETPLPLLTQMGGQTITQETNCLIENSHFGEKSHILLSELFFNQIKKDLVN